MTFLDPSVSLWITCNISHQVRQALAAWPQAD